MFAASRSSSMTAWPPPARCMGRLHFAGRPRPLLASRSAAAAAAPGVTAVLTARDIPGENQIGGIIPDEPLFAEARLHFIGQPIALVVAETPGQARAAVRLIKLEYEEEPPLLDPREAAARGELIEPVRVFALGEIDSAWQHCDFIIEGRADSGSQEHLYLETQGALASPEGRAASSCHSSTQGPTTVQRIVARVSGCPCSRSRSTCCVSAADSAARRTRPPAGRSLAALAAVAPPSPGEAGAAPRRRPAHDRQASSVLRRTSGSG